MLLAAGARPEFTTSAGETALSVAKSRDVERLIRRAIVVSKFKQTQPAPSSEDLPQSIEASPCANRNADQSRPIDVQLNEELFESLQSHKVHEEQPPPVDLRVQEEQPSVEFSHQQFKWHREPRYFFAAIIGASLLIMFMLLTWPGNLTVPTPHATQTVKPAKQIIKPPVEKPEPPHMQKSEIIVPEEHLTVDERPLPHVENMAVVKKRKQSASTIGDEEKNRLARALNNLGFSLIKQGRHGEAIPVLERSLRTFPKGTEDVYYAYALFNLGVAWRKAGRPDIAIPILEKRMKIEIQRDIVARELSTARQQAIEAGFQQ
ncbi:tetratricopeptide repeat protein [bacterium]|nr:tetratricopeptide repeat protein [bacterium]